MRVNHAVVTATAITGRARSVDSSQPRKISSSGIACSRNACERYQTRMSAKGALASSSDWSATGPTAGRIAVTARSVPPATRIPSSNEGADLRSHRQPASARRRRSTQCIHAQRARTTTPSTAALMSVTATNPHGEEPPSSASAPGISRSSAGMPTGPTRLPRTMIATATTRRTAMPIGPRPSRGRATELREESMRLTLGTARAPVRPLRSPIAVTAGRTARDRGHAALVGSAPRLRA